MGAGPWCLPKEERLVLLFANASDEEVKTEVRVDGRSGGIGSDRLRVTPVPGGPAFTAANAFSREVVFPARAVLVWEIAPD